MIKSFPINKLKERLKNGETVFGPFVRMNSPAIMEILGYAGFDFAIVDLEHGPMSYSEAENMVRAARSSEITPIIRVQENNETNILRALDTGAGGVQIPQINDAVSGAYAGRSSHYYPLGNRGVCKYVRSALYSAVPAEDYFQQSNREVLVVVHIEGKKGIEELDSILEIPEIDVIFLGPYDLSQSLGVPGQVNSPPVVKAMEKSVEMSRKAGKAVGTFSATVEGAHFWAERGVQYVSTFIDTGILFESAVQLVDRLKLKG